MAVCLHVYKDDMTSLSSLQIINVLLLMLKEDRMQREGQREQGPGKFYRVILQGSFLQLVPASRVIGSSPNSATNLGPNI